MTTAPTTPEFRERLGRTIKEKGLNESRLAKLTGISASTIANYRNGKTKPDKIKLKTLCDELGVSLEWMLTGEERPNMVSQSSPGYQKSDQIILSDSGIEAMYALGLEMRGLKDTIRESIKDVMREMAKESQKQNFELKQEIAALRRTIEKQNNK